MISFRTKIFLLCLTAALVGPVVVGFRAIRSERKHLKERVERDVKGSLQRVGNALRHLESRIQADLKLLAALPSVSEIREYRGLGLEEEAGIEEEALAEVFEGLLAREPAYLDLRLELPDGTQVTRSARPEAGPEEALPAISSQILDRWGQSAGTLTLRLRAKKLQDLLGELAGGPAVYLLEESKGVLLSVDSDVSEETECFLRKKAPKFLQAKGSRDKLMMLPGCSLWAFALPERALGTLPLVILDEADLLRDLERVQAELGRTFLLALLGSLLASFWIAEKLSQRIRPLSQAVQEMREGHLGATIESDGEDEIGHLIQGFNTMSSHLKETQEDLETRIHQLQTTRHRLVQAEKLSALGLLSAGIAHEINNPLMAISTLAGTIRRRVEKIEGQEETASMAGTISSEVAAAAEVTRSLLQYAHRGEVGEPRVPVDPLPACERALVLLGSKKRARVDARIEPVPRVLGSANRITQVVLNLLSNAVDACPSGEPVQLRVDLASFPRDESSLEESLRAETPFHGLPVPRTPQPGAPAVRIRVEDQGEGISDQDLEKLFDPFFTTKPVGAGTGLGLSIVHAIVAGMGGLLEVDSTPGEGSTFEIYLPLDEAP